MKARLAIVVWLLVAQWRTAPGRSAIAALAVALGVALALSIHLVNASALEEFRRAIATVNGDAHAQVRAASGSVDESLYASIARTAGVAAASPVLEIEAQLADADGGGTGLPQRLRIIGLDVFRAAQVTPALLPQAAADDERPGSAAAIFEGDAIFLSTAALERHGLRTGDRIVLASGLTRVPLRVAGTVPGVQPGQALAVMDVGTAQWRFDAIGRLSRIDLRLEPGIELAALARDFAVADASGAGAALVWSTPDAAQQRMSNLSRAYRVNLNVLALVALFTGGFIVYATMALAVARQQPQFALLAVLGASRSLALRAVLAQALAIGTVGAGIGVALGVALAAALLAAVGGDLGGGYFAATRTGLVVDPAAAAGFGALGVAVAIAGGMSPAIAAARLPAVRALRGGAGDSAALTTRAAAATALALAVAGAALLAMPPVAGLPLPAYAAIAAWLLAAIAVVPAMTGRLAEATRQRLHRRAWRHPPAWLALARVAGAPQAVAAALAGVVASFALSSAMVFMVTSFRGSVEQWLDRVLPADLYARAPAATGGALDEDVQRTLASLPGVARAEFLHASELVLAPERPPVALLARSYVADAPARILPLTGRALEAPADRTPIWVSEAMVDLYGMRPGNEVALPIGAGARFFVAGVWRDYARQHGAIVIDLADWRRLTGDARVSDVSLWLAPEARADAVLRSAASGDARLEALEFREAGAIRALSLSIFDRSFAVTYALEAIAILVGLFGVAATFAGDALARAREFGMLRHFGMRRREILAQVALEASAGVGVAVAWGAVVGTAIGLVLIHRVNPQSFHWTMDAQWPAGLIVGSAALLVAAAVAAAVLASRSTLGAGPVRAVREDW